MKSTPDQTQGMFVIGEIGEPELQKSSYSKSIYLLVTLLGLGFLAVSTAIYLFSAAIMIFNGLRVQYWNWGYSSLIVSILLFLISKRLRDHFGFMRFENLYNNYKISFLFGRTIKIDKTKIFAMSLQYQTKLFGLLKDLPYVMISTYDKNYEIPLYRYKNQQNLLSYFNEISTLIQDDYFTIFQKSEISYPSLFQRVWRQTSGKLGILIVLVYLFFAAWAAFSMILYPSNVLQAYSFYLKNPEISFSFLPGYDTGSIIYVPPNSTFIMGTDYIGRDVFARMVYGTFHAIVISIIAATITTILVVLFGISTGIEQGWWDELISRTGDLLLTFPPVLSVIIVATFIGAFVTIPELYYYYVFPIMGLILWPQSTKYLRNEVAEMYDMEYVIVARRAGASQWKLLKDHILPKIMPTIVLFFISTVTEVIIAMTMIGLIGLGSVAVTWGSDLSRVIIFTDLFDVPLKDRWWGLLYPSIWVGGLIVGLTLLSDSIRDQFQITVNKLIRRDDDA